MKRNENEAREKTMNAAHRVNQIDLLILRNRITMRAGESERTRGEIPGKDIIKKQINGVVMTCFYCTLGAGVKL